MKNKYISYFKIGILFSLLNFITVESLGQNENNQDKGWKYLELTDNDTVQRVYRLKPGSRLTFSEGNINIKTESVMESVPRGNVSAISHYAERLLTVKVSSEFEGYDIVGMGVEVIPVGDDSSQMVVSRTDSLGVARIQGLPSGEYRLRIDGTEKGLSVYESTPFYFSVNDVKETKLGELPLAPFNLTFNSEITTEGDFDVTFGWNGVDGLPLVVPYGFIPRIDGVALEETRTTECTVAAMEAGEHLFTVYGLTPGGLQTNVAELSFILELPASDFMVTATGDDESNIPLEGVTVELIAEDEIHLSETTDHGGVARFTSLPAGRYELRADAADLLVYPLVEQVSHKYNDGVEIQLEERVVSPEQLSYSIVANHNGLYDLAFAWKMDGEDADRFHGYKFIFQLDDREAVSTETCSFVTPDVEMGDHRAMVVAVTPSGRESQSASLDFKLEGAGVSEILNDGRNWRYFDLNGMHVNAENIQPGIYIRTDGSISEEIVITK